MKIDIETLNTVLKKRPSEPHVAYYPLFDSQADLTNHYYRACWYLPRHAENLHHVIMGTTGDITPGERPEAMGECAKPQDHIEIVDNRETYLDKLATASIVLTWAPLTEEEKAAFAKAKIRLLNVDTHDPDSIEYGSYCKVHWALLSKPQRIAMLEKARMKFKGFAQTIWDRNYEAAAVFGTGPSIDNCFDFDFTRCYTNICNSTVRSPELMNHIKPDLITAGDVVSHIGVSSYADIFRKDLFDYLRANDGYFLTTAQFGYLLTLQYPDDAHRILLCDQTMQVPNYNLLVNWGLPGLDSTLNIHMLPSAATLYNTVYIMGCDGKNPDESKNEDFWAHSKAAQYHDLVDTGHICHPTFDGRRQETTWQRFQNSTKATLDLGENRFGKRYISLAPSFTPGLDIRYRTADQIKGLPGHLVG